MWTKKLHILNLESFGMKKFTSHTEYAHTIICTCAHQVVTVVVTVVLEEMLHRAEVWEILWTADIPDRFWKYLEGVWIWISFREYKQEVV